CRFVGCQLGGGDAAEIAKRLPEMVPFLSRCHRWRPTCQKIPERPKRSAIAELLGECLHDGTNVSTHRGHLPNESRISCVLRRPPPSRQSPPFTGGRRATTASCAG